MADTSYSFFMPTEKQVQELIEKHGDNKCPICYQGSNNVERHIRSYHTTEQVADQMKCNPRIRGRHDFDQEQEPQETEVTTQ